MNKRAETGEFFLMMYRIVLVSVVALLLIGTSSIVYSYDVNVRNPEAKILGMQIVNCIAEMGELPGEDYKDSIISSCSFGGDLDRYYVRVRALDLVDREIMVFEEGDSGSEWVLSFASSNSKFLRYKPGYSKVIYDVDLGSFKSDSKIRLEVEVYVNAEY